MAKVSFDEITKVITVTQAPVDGEVVIDVRVDLYSDGKEFWVLNENLRKFAFPITTVGGNPLPGSKALGATFFLAADWKIKPYEASHKLVVNGNLYAEDGSDPFLDTIGTYTVRIIQQVSSLVDSTIQQLSEIEYASFGGGVTIDIINGSEGTDFPSGTKETPVNNLTDAVEIANERGFDTLFINKSMVLDAGTNIEGFTLVGKSVISTYIGIESSALCSNINIQHCNVSGTLDGGTLIADSNVGNLDYVYGHIKRCGLYGTISLAGNEEAVVEGCFMIDQDDPPTIDMGGSGQDLAMPNYSGSVTIRNLFSATEEIGVGLSSGIVTLEDTITAGSITIAGAGGIVDNSTGTADVNIDGLMSKDTIATVVYESIGDEIQYASFGGSVSINVLTGVSGIVYPAGTVEQPVNNISDAVSIAEERGFKKLFIIGDITFGVGDNLNNYVVMGESPIKSVITIDAGAFVTGTEFLNADIIGTLDGNNTIKNCKIRNLEYVEGYIQECLLETGTIVLGGSNRCDFLNCWSGPPGSTPIVDMGGSGRDLGIRAYSGAIKIINKTGADDKAVVDLISGHIVLDSTVTAGEVTVRGVGTLENYGTATIDDALLSQSCIANSVWNESFTEHVTVSGSTAEIIGQIKKLVNLIPAGL